MPTAPADGDRIAVLTPTTLPSWVKSGPPELPRLIGASICRKESYGPSPMSRPRAETIPAVTVPPSPNGLPTAITHWPGSTSSESPSWMKANLPGRTIRSRARSVRGSRPTIFAGRVLPSSRVTVTEVAPLTTWLLVTTKPSGEMMKPEPRASTVRFGLACGIWNGKGNGNGDCWPPP